MSPSEIASGTTMGRSYAYYIVAGTHIPHPRHYPNLAALVGVELPVAFAAALFVSAKLESSIVPPPVLVLPNSAESDHS